ncbi:Alpha/Beta hydrolase protein [Neurospora intermedia]|uniref:Alpha/Beta hydrolase protein n=1 Tax=Neurospora intermedia TaxID=5142 RepID=A0ABR3CZT8_NEUIN
MPPIHLDFFIPTTFSTAQDLFIPLGKDGQRMSYRLLGPSPSSSVNTPLVMLNGFRCTMDQWDPALIDPLAAQRPVILTDIPGVGRSEGAIPLSITEWAQSLVDMLIVLNIPQVDVFGYSVGGCNAQMMALIAEEYSGGKVKVRRLVLAGTTPSDGPGVKKFKDVELRAFKKLLAAQTLEQQRQAFMKRFFGRCSENCWAEGEKSWKRIVGNRKKRMEHSGQEGSERQGTAFFGFMGEGSLEKLKGLKIPVLIAHGAHDMVFPLENSYLMYKTLPNAYLHLYPDSGHGFLYQCADHFSSLINLFLDGEQSGGTFVPSKL